MLRSPEAVYNYCASLIQTLKARGYDASALERVQSTAYTTSSEWLGELRQAVLDTRSVASDRDLSAKFDEIMQYVHIAWPNMVFNSKRRWFQFHLLTAVLMMLAAGVCVYQNAKVRPTMFLRHDDGTLTTYDEVRGWPFPFLRKGYFYMSEEAESLRDLTAGEWHFIEPLDYPIEPVPWSEKLQSHCIIAIDVLCSGGIIVSVAFVSEYLLRRREGRKQ